VAPYLNVHKPRKHAILNQPNHILPLLLHSRRTAMLGCVVCGGVRHTRVPHGSLTIESQSAGPPLPNWVRLAERRPLVRVAAQPQNLGSYRTARKPVPFTVDPSQLGSSRKAATACPGRLPALQFGFVSHDPQTGTIQRPPFRIGSSRKAIQAVPPAHPSCSSETTYPDSGFVFSTSPAPEPP
jgi:hypothetical protein